MIQEKAYTTSYSLECGTLPVEVNISRFQGVSGVAEYNLMIQPREYGGIATQLKWISNAYEDAVRSIGWDHGTCVFRRFFCSDLPNQAAALETHHFANPNDQDEPCAISLVCQPPVFPAKIALWAYHIKDPHSVLEKSRDGASLLLKRDELTHIWSAGITHIDRNASYGQTEGIMNEYEHYLHSIGLNLADNVIRTWFFVQNIDTNYQGLVDARRDIFTKRGLTQDTHFIASTGIEGTSADVKAKVLMDAYAIAGVRSGQVEFISAPDHLSPTHTYGVTFERGVSVAYRDRKHILISGTASIDCTGKIVHHANLLQQLDRSLENVEALLKRAGAAYEDVCMFIVYLRDPSDLCITEQVMRERFGSAPIIAVKAPVCRPGWLVEVECQAVVSTSDPALPTF